MKKKLKRRTFLKITAASSLAVNFISCEGSQEDDNKRKVVNYNISQDVQTTRVHTLSEVNYTPDPNIKVTDVKGLLESEYGRLEKSEGEEHLLDKSLLAEPDNYSLPSSRKSLLFFAQISDIHLTDVQSPMRAVYGFVSGNGSAYRPYSIYSTHVLNSMIQTINAIHKKEKLDFLAVTGDMIDNAEGVELEWFNTILNGGVVRAVTGKDDYDPVAGGGNDFTDPYFADGLAGDLPWYATIGNHDILNVGVFYITDEKADAYVSDKLTTLDFFGCDVYTGTQDASTEYGDVQCGFEENVATGAFVPVATESCNSSEFARCDNPEVIPDKRRAPFRNHGEIIEDIKSDNEFNKNNDDEQKGYYSISLENVPIELIFLDLSASKEHFFVNGEFKPNSTRTNALLGEKQFNWLKDKLDSLKEESKGAIIFQHQPTGSFQKESEISPEEYIDLLQNYEDVLCVIAGHTHKNKILKHKAEGEGKFSFVEVVTCGLLDFPEQSRLFEFVYNDNGTVSLFTTMLNHASTEGSLSYNARRLSLAFTQLEKGGYGGDGSGTKKDRNTEIVLPISDKFKEKLENLNVNADYVKSLKV